MAEGHWRTGTEGAESMGGDAAWMGQCKGAGYVSAWNGQQILPCLSQRLILAVSGVLEVSKHYVKYAHIVKYAHPWSTTNHAPY
jgi:hypothetical protein